MQRRGMAIHAFQISLGESFLCHSLKGMDHHVMALLGQFFNISLAAPFLVMTMGTTASQGR